MASTSDKDELRKKEQALQKIGGDTGNSANIPDASFDDYIQEAQMSVYKNDPNFQKLLTYFQNANWQECLNQIDQFLVMYPEDGFLSAFKQDIEVRIKLQEAREHRLAEEKRESRYKFLLRFFAFTAWGLFVGVLFWWVFNSYTTHVTQVRLEKEAAQLAQTLAAKYQNAESLLTAGKSKEALALYNEIQLIYPGYRDIGQKIQLANNLLAVESLYQEGIQAVQEGKSEEALAMLLEVERLSPKYKDTLLQIQKIEQDQQIKLLIKDVKDAFNRQDWTGVVNAYEDIKAIDPFLKLSELDSILFVSYRNLIVGVAGRADATFSEVETAEQYYRIALSLAPQDKEFAAEREELQQIAVNLLANKYYLYGINLLESSNYSVTGLRESIRILNKAYNIGSGSPVIRSEIEKAQLFLDSYDDFLHRRWGSAITGLEQLNRREENYANGMLKYLLYEAYTARGDSLLAFSDFEGALIDYQEAEKYAWSSDNNQLRLFKIETRIAYTLRRLWRLGDAAEFYRYAFDRLNYQNLLVTLEQQPLLLGINNAKDAYKVGNELETVRLFEMAMENEEMLYEYKTIDVLRGDTLAQIAFIYDTTIENLRKTNNLGESMTFSSNQQVLVPLLPTENK